MNLRPSHIARLGLGPISLLVILGLPQAAFAHRGEPGSSSRHGGGRESVSNNAPEIDSSALGSSIALIAGGLTLLRARRQRNRDSY